MNESQTTEIEDAKKVLKQEADSILKAKEKLDDKLMELVKDSQKVLMDVTQSIDRMSARVDKDLEGVDVRLQNVEREVERIGR